MTTALVADDQAMQRLGFRRLLESLDDMTVVGEAANGTEAVNLGTRRHPDVALMDIHMPGLDGIEATRRIIRSGSPARVLIVTTFDLDEYTYEGLRAGASGFLAKDSLPEDLLRHPVRRERRRGRRSQPHPPAPRCLRPPPARRTGRPALHSARHTTGEPAVETRPPIGTPVATGTYTTARLPTDVSQPSAHHPW